MYRKFLVVTVFVICAFAVCAQAAELSFSIPEFLGPYADGQIRSTDLDVELPPGAIVNDVSMQLAGTAICGRYYDQMDPNETVYDFWAEVAAYFPGTSPHVYGYTNSDSETWSGEIDWDAIGGDLSWAFLNDGQAGMEVQLMGPSWVGFPVFLRGVSAEVTEATMTITYEAEVPNRTSTWSEIRQMFR